MGEGIHGMGLVADVWWVEQPVGRIEGVSFGMEEGQGCRVRTEEGVGVFSLGN